jgi:hypothetical protein
VPARPLHPQLAGACRPVCNVSDLSAYWTSDVSVTKAIMGGVPVDVHVQTNREKLLIGAAVFGDHFTLSGGPSS